MPINQFLLIRKGNEIGALRITRITPNAQKPQPPADWLGSVVYESYFSDGKHPLATAPLARITVGGLAISTHTLDHGSFFF